MQATYTVDIFIEKQTSLPFLYLSIAIFDKIDNQI